MTSFQYPTVERLLGIAERAMGERPLVRDMGLLHSSCHRPASVFFGLEQYPTLPEKAAAFMHSVARFHPLVDGNKRLALLGAYAMIGANGARFAINNRQAADLTLAVAAGELSEVSEIAKVIDQHIVYPEEHN